MENPFLTIKLSLIFSFSFLLISSLSFGQATPLTYDDFKSGVATNNYSLKISEVNRSIAQADLTQSNAVFLPNISLSYTGITTTNPLMAFGAKLNQEILTQNDFTPSLLNNPSRIDDFTAKINIQQPLINIDGIYKRKAAKATVQSYKLQATRTKEQLELQVFKTYMQLQLAYKATEVLEKSLEAATENTQLTINSFEQGLLQKSDVLAVKVRLTEVQNSLQVAQSNIQNSSDVISLLMGKETNVIYLPKHKLSAVNPPSLQGKSLKENRSDLAALKKNTEAYLNNYKAQKTGYLPRLNAFGSYEIHDGDFTGTTARGYLVGAQLSWTIFNGNKRLGKIQKSKALLDKSILDYNYYKAQSYMAFQQSLRNLKNSKLQLQLSKLAMEQSKEVLRIRLNRYKQGLEKTSDLLFSETQYSQKQLEYYRAIFNYNYSQATLKFLSK
ncbi:MAG: TolC family protein [Flavobacteriaceae bacterium]|nr:TolC family protein [Flavobacteriaceae bacterium]